MTRRALLSLAAAMWLPRLQHRTAPIYAAAYVRWPHDGVVSLEEFTQRMAGGRWRPLWVKEYDPQRIARLTPIVGYRYFVYEVAANE